MEKREKVDFLLEQMRLCLDNRDFIRAQIMSNKINRKVLTDPDCQDLKLRFYEQMIRYHAHDSTYIEICKYVQRGDVEGKKRGRGEEQRRERHKVIVNYVRNLI